MDLLNINQLLSFRRSKIKMKYSTFLHLRIPFSYFLLPVFLLACSVVSNVDIDKFWLIFFILHVLIYPASNGYNSYFDKDEKSIGGLENPPPVTKELYWTALVMDLLGLLLGLFISMTFTLMIFIYGLVSKAYSHTSVRLKKFPIAGWLAAGIFQGYFTYLACVMGMMDIPILEIFTWELQFPGILSSVLLLGSYPMTQVYQHEEDGKRGDETISRLLGINNTFHFTAILFSFAMAGFGYYFLTQYSIETSFVFLGSMSPVLFYFISWYLRVKKSELEANFKSTMRLNFLSATALNAFFLWLWLL
jgi:1,4-dihydroxy-2-naphthoate octaprenyltransferase